MSIKIETKRQLVWDKEQSKMVIKIMVYAQLIGNADTLFAEEGPLYCDTGKDVFDASQLLKDRLIKNLISSSNTNEQREKE